VISASEWENPGIRDESIQKSGSEHRFLLIVG
jgi:hypothetical protein